MSAVPVLVPVDRPSRPQLRLVPDLPTAPPAPRTVRPAAPLRLTRRGMVAIGAIALTVTVLCGLLVAHAVAPAASGPDSVVVQSGQTLSEVAHRALPQLPVREAVVRVQLANDLNSLQVSAGQTLLIPR
ncbi:LysM peptidoglycan-binding domain-containing protein [Branchiibius sp. NY16-3462-2]|uniref:LysM peptidoglycan-binding domain-containing protein n=1 Tax=Branchiibius sp. NY16-3462-2 TaxID=1807500 RepID=UPI0007952589|nr:LysM peptidoglycan-binding domain-containing protein [Branchiibius sp. NY16-3462-2]KYH43918.1 hypothetical protein AZH51_03990 [Branchiibius sp. NY16-3462-2]